MTHEGAELQRRFESIKKHARRTYDSMRGEIPDKQPAIVDEKLGKGFIIHGSIASHIRKASREATGHDCNEERITQVRAYLRHTHNVCALNKVGDGFTYRIFVRDEWNEWDAVLPLVFGLVKDERASRNWYERKVTPEEAGETRPPGEVKISYQCKHCDRRFDSPSALGGHVQHHQRKKAKALGEPTKIVRHQGLTPYHRKALVALHSMPGGVVESSKGFATPLLAKAADLDPIAMSSVVKVLHDNGLVERTKGNHPKRTVRIALTPEGRERLREESLITADELRENSAKAHKDEVSQANKHPAPNPPVEHPNIGTLPLKDVSDHHLVSLVLRRMLKYRDEAEAAKNDTSAQQKLDLIISILTDFEEGKIGALKALGDVQEATRL